MRAAADRDLLFGLIALQNGMIDQSALVAAFQAWVRDKSRPLADHLADPGGLDAEVRVVIEAMVALHLKKHDGDAGVSLASIPAARAVREGLAGIGDPDLEATLANVGMAPGRDTAIEAERIGTYSTGDAAPDGQRFRLLRPHAQGGLGEVFVALDAELNREVALKQILDRYADDPGSRSRFVLEAEITGGLEHPGIVPVYGLGSYGDGRPFYAMRFIRGDTLNDAIAGFHAEPTLGADPGRRSLALRELLRRFVDVCNAIDYAHSRGVLHRDIKPANVIVGRHGETLVVDWGLAKVLGSREPRRAAEERTLILASGGGAGRTLPGSALGTPSYMSPEQATGDPVLLGPCCDVYSLGATLYCLLTGRPPFVGDVGDVLRAVQRGEFPPPRQLDASLDRALEAVCLKAMSLEPEDRYSTPRALADDVERWMADEPVIAWHEPLPRRARRWARRNRSPVMAASAAAMMALAGLAAVLAVQARSNVRLQGANLELGIANAKVTRANTDLNAANERERQRFDLTIEAIRRYHTDVSEDFLLKQDQFKDLRDRLLGDAVAFYRRLEGLLSDQADVRSRRALGLAYEEVGELTDKIGSVPEAIEAHRRALLIRRALAREPSAEPATGADLGRSLIAVADLLERTGRYDPALASLEEARSVLSGLTASGALRESALHDVARSYYHSGIALRGIGRPDAGVVAFERGIAIEESLVAVHPDRLDSQRILSWCYNDIGNVLIVEGKYSGALKAYEESRRIKQKIVDDHPSGDEFRRDLALAEGNIGIILRETGHPEEALASLERTRAIFRDLAKKYPAQSRLLGDLAYAFIEIGEASRMAGHRSEAEKSYKDAIAMFGALMEKNGAVTEYRERSIQAMKGLGAVQLTDRRAAEAAATWSKAIAIGEGLPSAPDETLYWLAGCHALLGGVAGEQGSSLSTAAGAAELDRAMETLHRAVAAGYRSVAWMRLDPDLEPLRSRPDFQLLMMDLAFPAAPFAR